VNWFYDFEDSSLKIARKYVLDYMPSHTSLRVPKKTSIIHWNVTFAFNFLSPFHKNSILVTSSTCSTQKHQNPFKSPLNCIPLLNHQIPLKPPIQQISSALDTHTSFTEQTRRHKDALNQNQSDIWKSFWIWFASRRQKFQLNAKISRDSCAWS
jgi:hypothetical protein